MELACSANLERVFSPLDQSEVILSTGKGKLRKKLSSVTTNQHSKNFCLLYYIVIVIVDGQFAAYALKYIYNCRKDEELVRLLRSYAKQISINAMKKIGAPLLGLAKYIYYRWSFQSLTRFFVLA